MPGKGMTLAQDSAEASSKLSANGGGWTRACIVGDEQPARAAPVSTKMRIANVLAMLASASLWLRPLLPSALRLPTLSIPSNAPGRTRTSDLRFRLSRGFHHGPDHLFTRQAQTGPGRVPGASTGARATNGAGVLPGRLTRWSLHLPPAVPLPGEIGTPRRRLGSGLPATAPRQWGGFPRVHPVRLGPFPGRAPLSRRKPSLYPAELRAHKPVVRRQCTPGF